jgi:hypothetical protein
MALPVRELYLADGQENPKTAAGKQHLLKPLQLGRSEFPEREPRSGRFFYLQSTPVPL